MSRFVVPTRTDHRPWDVPARPWSLAMTWWDLLFMHWPVPVRRCNVLHRLRQRRFWQHLAALLAYV